jgi:ribosomal protein S18 acetylase RimI-like enzyme
MGNRGRFGKYGEIKRLDRLRKAKAATHHFRKAEIHTRQPKALQKRRDRHSDPQIRVRESKAEDVDFIRDLSEKAFSPYGPYEEILPQWFESGATLTYVAFMGKTPVGFAMFGKPAHIWYFPVVHELLAIAVEPEKQKLGIGDLLMQTIISTVKKLGVDKIVLHTAPDNSAALSLFKKHGFGEFQVKAGFYPKGQDAIMMYKDI